MGLGPKFATHELLMILVRPFLERGWPKARRMVLVFRRGRRLDESSILGALLKKVRSHLSCIAILLMSMLGLRHVSPLLGGVEAKCGWVVFPPEGPAVGQAVTVPPEWIASWEPRETQIFAAEAFCALLVPFNLPHLFQGQDLIWFVDNEAAAAAIIRGSSSSSDVDSILQLSALLLLQLEARLWVEWINSDANPSDGLSRDGLDDSWTLEQGWDLSAARLPSTSIHETLGTLGFAFDGPKCFAFPEQTHGIDLCQCTP